MDKVIKNNIDNLSNTEQQKFLINCIKTQLNKKYKKTTMIVDKYETLYFHLEENVKTKNFIDGTVRVFVSVENIKCLDILNGLVNLNEVLFNYLRNRILFNYERKGKFQYL